MIVICEECGKKYRIDPEKIKGKEAKFKCKSCMHEIIVHKPEPAQETPPPPSPSMPEPEPASAPEPPSSSVPKEEPPIASNRTLLGVRGKMILLFFVLPVIISGLAALYTMTQISDTAEEIVEASSNNIRHIAELMVTVETKVLSERLNDYIASHPAVTPSELVNAQEIKKALQSGGTYKGDLTLYSLPGPDGSFTALYHSDPKLSGTDLRELKKTLGPEYPGFFKLISNVENNSPVKGYVQWKEPNGTVQRKFMIVRPVEGMPLAVANIIDESQMMQSVNQLQTAAEDQIFMSRYLTFGIMLFAFLLIGVIVTVYGHSLTSRLKYLTDVSDRISVGDLDTEIRVRSNDEIGALADAISRMQDSLRLSIERLRRRR